jgi:hypothetical protein
VVRPDDCSLTPRQRQLIRQHADRALREADALGIFPTPVDAVMDAAKVHVADENLSEEGLLVRLRRTAGTAGKALRRALGKVLGVLHVAARIVYLDKAVHIAKIPFLKLHETAHAVLPWQRDIYAVTEDCQKTLSPEIADEFEREANGFASEVIFQMDGFTQEAADYDFNILVPVKLSRRYGASIYSAVRRYVSQHHRCCAVLVLDPPSIHLALGYFCRLRRVVVSPVFEQQFGDLNWPESYSPNDEIGAAVPVGGKKMSGKRQVTLVDRNGNRHQCLAEAFTQTHQVFVLIHSVKMLAAT